MNKVRKIVSVLRFINKSQKLSQVAPEHSHSHENEKSSERSIRNSEEVDPLVNHENSQINLENDESSYRSQNEEPLLEDFEKEVDYKTLPKKSVIRPSDEDYDDYSITDSTNKSKGLFSIQEEEEELADHKASNNGDDDDDEPNDKSPSISDSENSDSSNSDKSDDEDAFEPEIEKQEMEIMMEVAEDNRNYSNDKLRKRYSKKFLVYPDDSFRSVWNVIILVLLLYVCTIMPYKLAFMNEEDGDIGWKVIDYSIDILFSFDIIINFFTAYFDREDNLVTSYKKIAINYISTWFFLDLIGVFPFDIVINESTKSDKDDNRYNNLARVARLPRIYKLVRMSKILRLLKIIKEKSKVMKYVSKFIKFGAGIERLILSILSIFIFCHIAACIWYIVADLNEDPDNWIMVFQYLDSSNFKSYVASFYWVTQTVVTVGYGDISPQNTIERTMACFLMFVGVFFYSFTIGSLSSLLSSLDSKNASFDQKMNILLQIKNQYGISNYLYNKVKRALKYRHVKTDEEKINFLNELPMNLRIDLSLIMYRPLLSGIDFFKYRQPRFIAFIGPFLKPIQVGKDEIIFSEGEYADEMYFIKKGSVSMVLRDYNNFPFMTIVHGYYFGEVDLLFSETRKYSYIADCDCELLSLQKKNFTKIFFQEFREVGSEIYKNALKRRMRSVKAHDDAIIYCQKEAEIQKRRMLERQKTDQFKAQISIAKGNVSSLQEEDFVKEIENENDKPLLRGNEINLEAQKRESGGWSKLKDLISKSPMLKRKGNLLDDDNLEDQKEKENVSNDFKDLSSRMNSIDSKISNIFKLYEKAGIKRDDEEEKKESDDEEESKSDIKSSPINKLSPNMQRSSISLTGGVLSEKNKERRLSHGNFFNLVKLQSDKEKEDNPE